MLVHSLHDLIVCRGEEGLCAEPESFHARTAQLNKWNSDGLAEECASSMAYSAVIAPCMSNLRLAWILRVKLLCKARHACAKASICLILGPLITRYPAI